MAKPGIGVEPLDKRNTPVEEEIDKTKVFTITDEKQLESLRQKTMQAFLAFKNLEGEVKKLILDKPRTIIGSAKDADVSIAGWLVPSIAATVERQGATYELVPGKRGKVIFRNRKLTESARLNDGDAFLVRDREFMFFKRLVNTSE